MLSMFQEFAITYVSRLVKVQVDTLARVAHLKFGHCSCVDSSPHCIQLIEFVSFKQTFIILSRKL